MVHVLGLQLWGEIRIPEVLGSNTQTSSLYLKLRLTDLGLDIVNFYPSISEDLLRRAVSWAKTLTTISDEDIEIIFASKESVLYNGDVPWVKREGEEFDITMGSYDGAETTDLVGLFLLHQLKHLPVDLGLYRDDGLAVSALTNRLTEKLWQQIKQVYEDNGLKVTAEVNKKVINFLDVTLDLNTGTHRPYMKPNTTLLYISSLSDHPQEYPLGGEQEAVQALQHQGGLPGSRDTLPGCPGQSRLQPPAPVPGARPCCPSCCQPQFKE